MAELKKKVVTSTIWLSLFQGLDQGIGFVRLLVLTRFLTPAEFGYVGFAWLVMQIISTFTQPGLQTALIQKKGDIKEYLDIVWSFLILRGLILFGLMFLIGPYVATFFKDPGVAPIVRGVSFVFLLESFVNIGMTHLQKEMDFKKQFIFLLSGSIIDFTIAVTLAIITGSVWAIIIGLLCNNLIKVFLSYYLSSYRPNFNFNFKKIRELHHFGKWIFISNILMFLYSQGDDILVGRMLGVGSLGLYQTAYKISNMPTTQITYVFSTVMFPALSRIQDDLKKISRTYEQAVQLIAFLSIMIGYAIIYFSKDFVTLFLGDQWLPMVVSLQILTLWGMIRSIGATTGPLWQSLAKHRFTTYTQIIQVMILVIFIYPLTMRWGIAGTSVAVVIAALVPNIISFVLVRFHTECSTTTLLKNIILPILAGFFSTLFTNFIKQQVFGSLNIITFFILCMIFLCIYLIITLILDRLFRNDLTNNILTILKNGPLKSQVMKRFYSSPASQKELTDYEN